MAIEQLSPTVTVPDGKILAEAYRARLETGEFDQDAAQLKLVQKLDTLLISLEDSQLASKQSALGWLFSKKQSAAPKNRGLYIWGPVGRGKTMLMDMFFDHVSGIRKRRVHFHDFMQEIHQRIHTHRQALKRGETTEKDPLPPVARALASEAQLLCFDEFSVTDVADAMILSRLFTKLFELGVTVVATSNVAIDALYPNGLNRQFFLSFVELLKLNVDTFWLDAHADFRLEKLVKAEVYIVGTDQKAKNRINRLWQDLTGTVLGGREKLVIKGRELIVPQASRGAARFSFEELCEQPLAAGDYLAIARRYHSVFIDDIPQMGLEMRNEAKRFIILIDALYDHHINVLCTAEVLPDALYTATSGVEHFEFARTSSRLMEMQSNEYLEKSRGLDHHQKITRQPNSAL